MLRLVSADGSTRFASMGGWTKVAGGSELDCTADALVGCGWFTGFMGFGVSGLPAFGDVGVRGLLVSDCD